MTSTDLRSTFNEVPHLYDRARPGYPGDLLAGLAELTGIGPGSRVLEIGPGTGQATVALAALGARVTAVELGAGLAEVLVERLAQRGAGDARVVVSSFEDWPLPAEPFDAVVSFCAWHWLDPAVRTEKVAAALVPGGSLATVTVDHVRGGSSEFFDQAQDCYRRWDPATPPGQLLEPADRLPPYTDEADRAAAFQPATRRRYHQDITYRTGEYLDVLNTYSGHLALPVARRRGLLECLGQLIDQRHGGRITKRYLYELRVARVLGQQSS
jgi:SAM-dependent methyltransferase